MAIISVIVPAYNEEKNLSFLIKRLLEVFFKSNHIFELIIINDGSTDDTESVLKELSNHHSNIYYINLSRNFGQQNALRAGYAYATGDVVICMDADLQNPPEMIAELINKWEEGYDVVLCKRRDAKQNGGVLKEFTSKFFYKIINLIADIPLESSSPDFRLMDRKLVDVVNNLPEKDIFFRGIIAWMGFKKAVVEYNHSLRIHGKTNYSYSKMFNLAISGLTSFSVKPLNMAIYIGLFISGLSLLYVPYVFIKYYFGYTVSGWSSLIVTVTFIGGLQLFILGIIGLYIGKLFIQSKQRPQFIVRDTNLKDNFALMYKMNN